MCFDCYSGTLPFKTSFLFRYLCRRDMKNDTSQRIHQILKQYWGYDSFRPMQEDIVLSVLEGRDTLALLPTGGGKSVCFQVPAIALGGLCLVVSPLIALMKDQVAHLRERDIKAVAIYSGMNSSEIEDALSAALFDPECRFLYVSPERLMTNAFRQNFARMPVRMIAVDEAHCISQWGYDFRPPYLEIAQVRKIFPKAPVLALTATATPEVVSDIQMRLGFPSENVFRKSFKRENLTYFVVEEEDKYGRLLRIANRYPGTGIVYVRNRRKTAEVAEFLTRHGVPSECYHAGMDAKLRDRRQNDWMAGRIRVMVATNAFGMGIDKPDVRFVAHLDLPDTLEAYFQEAGRGGRDGLSSVAVLLYDEYDLRQLKRNFTLAFPPLEKVREVYRQLCQHYYIKMGEGQNTLHPFHLAERAHEAKMDVVQYFNALQLLEKAGVIVLSEHLREKSQIRFNYEGDQLLRYENAHEEEAEFIKLLLRSYEGVFSRYANIDEHQLAERCSLTDEEVVERLHRLSKAGVLSYHPQSAVPLLVFVQDRIDERYLYFEPQVYAERKRKAEERMLAVKHYVTSSNICRSQLLLNYFGETDSTPCGGCDVCLRRKKFSAPAAAEAIARRTRELAAAGITDRKQLFETLALEFDEGEVADTLRRMADVGML